MKAGYSFCIITNGKRMEKLKRQIETIRALNIPRYEIWVGGALPVRSPDFIPVFYPMPELAEAGRLGAMRNALCGVAGLSTLVVTDDDMLFHDDFYTGMLQFGKKFDVLCTKLLNPDCTRYWDWATYGGPKGHRLLEYGEQDPNIYVTGGRVIMKRRVFDQVQWNPDLTINHFEDVDFSRRLHEAGFKIEMNQGCTMTHDDPRYTQIGCGIYQK